jgi:hypothetical protein
LAAWRVFTMSHKNVKFTRHPGTGIRIFAAKAYMTIPVYFDPLF